MKTIGLDGSRAFLKYRTGIEEYSYQVIRHLRNVLIEEKVCLYVRKKLRLRQGRLVFVYPEIDFSLPTNWELRGIWAPRFWTQLGLSLEMLLHPVERLFVPAHTLPLIGGKQNIVTVHGLEYEVSPASYGFWERLYMRYSIRYSCWKADRVIAVSENTKQDLIRLYATPQEKIQVIGEGYVDNFKFQISNFKKELKIKNLELDIQLPYILFIGRIEERKNVERIIDAFEILKEKYQRNEQLVLVGKQGHGYERIKNKVVGSKYRAEIQERGYVTAEEKQQLLQSTSVFVFPSLYEGFGLPVLEAQALGIPVVTSNVSSLPEVGGEGALYVDPLSAESIAQGILKIFKMSQTEKQVLQEKMCENLKRFSWEKCAVKIGGLF